MNSMRLKISKSEWEKELQQCKVTKGEMNQLIMDYLVIEGYKDAAERFSEETGLNTNVDLASIEERMKIRNNIQNGDIEAAIELVNDLNPELLETEPRIFFHLRQQQLIELLRQNKTIEALQFAQEELAAKGEEFPELLPELENTMSLFACDLDHKTEVLPDEIGALLDYKHRQTVASELNAAILSSQSQPKEPRLPALLQLLFWSQEQLGERATFPKITNVFTGELSNEEE
ncbi:Glucose-induced degradation protein-like protein [Zancudomyces culisetae]|uniref:Glucose-induced degradation protein-like protein n=1 Tax=Zancudomyces culisetae TaxID=1213189 RepID=A0A1R1PRD2_ZANCU|nr:Glucose-induced degradation protein-like protein [Zancudomyces culisetae]|eukprot:OMH83504.1 Glucose-induced degradation protein-like protein [Zancudomyces culisetae]